jgi:hypothetical protein
MGVPANANPLLLGAAAGYQVARSLRFNSADSAYLSKTFASAGNNKVMTWAGWVKLCSASDYKALLLANTGSFTEGLRLENNGTLRFYLNGTNNGDLVTTQVFRDFSAWYHITCAVDTTQATASERVKLYVNGSQVTSFSTASYPTQNYSLTGLNAASLHAIGTISNSFYGNFYLAEAQFIDGQALTPSSFTETDATTGQLVPKAFSGSYGTNGFYLNFADNSGTTATTLGKDSSGNGNNFTPNNFSVTAGAGNDSLVDSPTNYGSDTGAGGEVRGNYATWSPLYAPAITLANGNLEASVSATTVYGSISVASGKWYWEVTPSGTVSTNTYIGVIDSTYLITNASWNTQARCYVSNGNKYDGALSSYGASFGAGDVIGVALDLDAGTLVFYKNGTSQGTAFSTGLTGKEWRALAYTGQSATHTVNFGQRPFAYQNPGTNRPSADFKALCTQNLPTPIIVKPNTAMDVVTYAGTGSALTPTSSLGFSPDLVWIKSRSAATDHALYDTVRGAQARLESNTTDTETTSDSGVTAFDSNGFTLGTLAQVNTNAATYVGWCWDAGSSTVTNTAGSLTSSVRANTSAGISVVTFTSASAVSNNTFGHGLGVSPAMVIMKTRDSAGNYDNWITYHSAAGNDKYLELNTTIAATSTNTWQNTTPSSSIVYLAAGGYQPGNWVAYCFAPVTGFSSFGSFVGNGNADGPFCWCGFRPRWILMKASSTGGSTYDWFVYDTARDTFNTANKFLSPNYAGAEQVTADAGTLTDLNVDVLSNGFKIRTNRGRLNLSSTTFIYAAFAEAPFNYARAR